MTEHFDSMIRIPVLRADLYPHRDDWPVPGPSEVQRLEVDHLGVDMNVRESDRVTVAASGPDPMTDPYGVELDLEPTSARRLARQLLAAADACEAEAAASDRT